MNNISIFLKNSNLTEKVQWQIAHCKNNIIDLVDSSCGEDEVTTEECDDDHSNDKEEDDDRE